MKDYDTKWFTEGFSIKTTKRQTNLCGLRIRFRQKLKDTGCTSVKTVIKQTKDNEVNLIHKLTTTVFTSL